MKGGWFNFRIGTLLWVLGIVAVVSLSLSTAGGIYSLRGQDRMIDDLAGFYLSLMEDMCTVSYLLGQQKAILGLGQGRAAEFKRNSVAIRKKLSQVNRYLSEAEGNSEKEKEILSALREGSQNLQRTYENFAGQALDYLHSPDAQRQDILAAELEDMDRKVSTFLRNMDRLNSYMKIEARSFSHRSQRRALGVALVGLVLTIFSFTYALRIFKRNLGDYRSRMQDLAEGEADLTKRVAITGNTELDEAAVYTNRFLDKIHGLIRDLRETVENLSQETRRLAEAFGISVKGAEKGLAQSRKTREFASELEQEIASMAAAMEEMSATISEISQNTQETSHRARESQEAAEITARAAAELQEASRHIREMSDLIGAVAEQTKLLALNATIEAARAGEAGKGFAVVANEVKELARQSAELVEKINRAVEGLLSKVDEVAQASQRNQEAANAIAEMAQSVAAAVEEQSTVVNDLSANLTRITEKSKELFQEAEEMERLSQGILDEARKLNTDELMRIGEKLEKLLNSFKV